MSSAKNEPNPSTNPPSLTLSPNCNSSICLIDPSSIVIGVPAKKHLLQPLLQGGAGDVIVVEIRSLDILTIATSVNVQDFVYVSFILGSSGTATSSTRMLLGGGLVPGAVDDIQSLTMATLGNSVNFGNLTRSHGLLAIGASSDKIRGVFAGGSVTPVIDYVTIATQGDAVDFGDLTQQRYSAAAMSNSHGGL